MIKKMLLSTLFIGLLASCNLFEVEKKTGSQEITVFVQDSGDVVTLGSDLTPEIIDSLGEVESVAESLSLPSSQDNIFNKAYGTQDDSNNIQLITLLNSDVNNIELSLDSTARSIIFMSPVFFLRSNVEKTNIINNINENDLIELINIVKSHVSSGTSWADDYRTIELANLLASEALINWDINVQSRNEVKPLEKQGSHPYLEILDDEINFINPNLNYYSAGIIDAQTERVLDKVGFPVEGRVSLTDFTPEISHFGSLPSSLNTNKSYIVYLTKGCRTYHDLTGLFDATGVLYNVLALTVKLQCATLSVAMAALGVPATMLVDVISAAYASLPLDMITYHSLKIATAIGSGDFDSVKEAFHDAMQSVIPTVKESINDFFQNEYGIDLTSSDSITLGEKLISFGTNFLTDALLGPIMDVADTIAFIADLFITPPVTTYLITVLPDSSIKYINAFGKNATDQNIDIVESMMAPDSPSNITLTTTSDSYTISWNAKPHNAEGYRVYDKNMVLKSPYEIDQLAGVNGEKSITINEAIDEKVYIVAVSAMGSESMALEKVPDGSTSTGGDTGGGETGGETGGEIISLPDISIAGIDSNTLSSTTLIIEGLINHQDLTYKLLVGIDENSMQYRDLNFIDNTFNITNLNPGTRYFTQLEVSNLTGDKKKSNLYNFVTPENNSPTSPSSLVIKNLNSNSLELHWEHSTDHIDDDIRYYVYVKKISSESFEKKGETIYNSYYISGLESNTDYDVLLQAVDNWGANSSAEISFKTQRTSFPPSKPTNLQVIWVNEEEVKIKWSSSIDPEGGIITYKSSLSSQTTTLNELVIKGLRPKSDYSVYVTAVDDQGYSVISDRTNFKTSFHGFSLVKVSAGGNITKDYFIGKYELGYREWFNIYNWAISNGYKFKNKGREGSGGRDGAPPTEGKFQPVTKISWYDAVTWCNALSKKMGLKPVYFNSSGNEIKDATVISVIDFKDVIADWSSNGYRLPTAYEWNFAYIGGNNSKGYRYSGSNSSREAGWMREAGNYNEGYYSKDVALKVANELRIYDMTGNNREYCWNINVADSGLDSVGPESYPPAGPYETQFYFRMAKGGTWIDPPGNYTLHGATKPESVGSDYYGHYRFGFRIAKSIN